MSAFGGDQFDADQVGLSRAATVRVEKSLMRVEIAFAEIV